MNRLFALAVGLLVPAVALADLPPPGPTDLCGCTTLGLLPVPLGALALVALSTRRARESDA